MLLREPQSNVAHQQRQDHDVELVRYIDGVKPDGSLAQAPATK
jgi:hypothetical protein